MALACLAPGAGTPAANGAGDSCCVRSRFPSRCGVGTKALSAGWGHDHSREDSCVFEGEFTDGHTHSCSNMMAWYVSQNSLVLFHPAPALNIILSCISLHNRPQTRDIKNGRRLLGWKVKARGSGCNTMRIHWEQPSKSPDPIHSHSFSVVKCSSLDFCFLSSKRCQQLKFIILKYDLVFHQKMSPSNIAKEWLPASYTALNKPVGDATEGRHFGSDRHTAVTSYSFFWATRKSWRRRRNVWKKEIKNWNLKESWMNSKKSLMNNWKRKREPGQELLLLKEKFKKECNERKEKYEEIFRGRRGMVKAVAAGEIRGLQRAAGWGVSAVSKTERAGVPAPREH